MRFSNNPLYIDSNDCRMLSIISGSIVLMPIIGKIDGFNSYLYLPTSNADRLTSIFPHNRFCCSRWIRYSENRFKHLIPIISGSIGFMSTLGKTEWFHSFIFWMTSNSDNTQLSASVIWSHGWWSQECVTHTFKNPNKNVDTDKTDKSEVHVHNSVYYLHWTELGTAKPNAIHS